MPLNYKYNHSLLLFYGQFDLTCSFKTFDWTSTLQSGHLEQSAVVAKHS